MLGFLINVIRTINYFGSVMFVSFWMLVISPLLLLHKPLRRAGVRERYLPGALIVKVGARFILCSAGIDVRRHLGGQSKTVLSSGAIYMFNHSSYLDAIICMGYCPVTPKAVFKKMLTFIPLFGQVSLLYGGVAIDRGNREKAIAACNKMVKKLVSKHQYVMVSPEGTRSTNGKLLPFKKGPFHMAIQGQAPVIPVILENPWNLLPKNSFLVRSGCVEITCLPPLSHKTDESVDELMERTRAAFDACSWTKGKGRKPSFVVEWVCPTLAAAGWMYGLFWTLV